MKFSVRTFLSGFTVITAGMLVAQNALCADFYVAPNGSDSASGTVSAPFATFAKAYGLASAGTTIYLRGGNYAPSVQFLLNKNGTASSPIRVFNYPGEVPVLDGSKIVTDGYTGGAALRITGNFNHVKGLEIKNGPEYGAVMDKSASGNIFELLNVHHNGWASDWEGKGIGLFESAANNLILNCDSHHNQDRNLGNADGFQSMSSGSGNVFRGNRAWRNSDDGYDFYDAAPVLLENNWAWENGFDDNLRRLGDGNGFKLGGQHSGLSSGGHMVRGNLAWRNPLHGFDQNGALRALTLYNNTAFSNGSVISGGESWGENFYLPGVAGVLKNNLSYNGSVNVNGGDSNNSWNLAVSVSNADFLSLDFSSASSSRKTDGSLPTLSFMCLVSGSDLIDKGVDVGLAYSGSRPDLGAFEFALVAPSPTPTPVPTPAPTPTPVPTPSPTPAPSSVNLVANPGFEQQLTSWSRDYGNARIVSRNKYSGSYALRVGTGEGGRGQQINGIIPGATYSMTAFARVSSDEELGGSVSIAFYDAAGVKLGNDIGFGIRGKNWAPYSHTAVAPAGAASLVISVWKENGPAYLFVDDLSLKRVP